MSILKEGQADTGHETHSQVWGFSPTLCGPPDAAAHLSGYKRKHLQPMAFEQHKDFPDSECGRGEGTGVLERPESHLPGVWDKFPCVQGDFHTVLSAHLGGEMH